MTNRAANQGRSSEPVTWACCGEMQSVRPQGFVWFRLQHNTSLAHQRGNISTWGMQQERAQRGRWWISDPKFVNAWAIPGIISDAEVADAFFPRSKHSVAFFPIKPLQGWSAHPRLGFAHGQHLRTRTSRLLPGKIFSSAVRRSHPQVNSPSSAWSSFFCFISSSCHSRPCPASSLEVPRVHGRT